MKSLKLIPFLLIMFGIFPFQNLLNAGSENPSNYKVLASNNKKLSVANVEYYLKQGDKFILTKLKIPILTQENYQRN